MHSRLSIFLFVPDAEIAQSLTKLLGKERYKITETSLSTEFTNVVEINKEQIDCLIVLKQVSALSLLNKLYEQGILLPIIIIEPEEELESDIEEQESPTFFYHSAEVKISLPQLEVDKMVDVIDLAITKFLHLGPSCALSEGIPKSIEPIYTDNQQNFLILQQRRLAEKLKERLGYLGVYYKRNPQYFYRHLTQREKKDVLKQLNLDYRQIILDYFSEQSSVNQSIDQFVNQAFFADISVSQILEIHMELMDEFAQQLKLEGRNEDILLDYRLVLIDIIAHLCEMYRRSIPREDVPFDPFFQTD